MLVTSATRERARTSAECTSSAASGCTPRPATTSAVPSGDGSSIASCRRRRASRLETRTASASSRARMKALDCMATGSATG
eukprot:scaffold54498_cov31-Tisochrysis_lutea.AAC.3